jgi:hypothetical protein
MINDIEVEESELPTSLAEIEKFEELIRAKLPEDYKQFLLKHNGGHPIMDGFKLIQPVNEQINEAVIDWFYALYDGEACNIVKKFNTYKNELSENLLAIAYDSGGRTCLGIKGEEYNKVYYWTTNWSFWRGEEYNKLYLAANTFSEFIHGMFQIEIDEEKRNVIKRYQDGTVTITPIEYL